MPHHFSDVQPRSAIIAPGRRRHIKRSIGMGYLAGLCVASLIALGLLLGYVTFFRNGDGPLAWNVNPAAGEGGRQIPDTEITTGMTVKDVRNLHSDLIIDDVPAGSVSSFVLNGRTHTLWFTGRDPMDRVYRIRLETVLTASSPDQFIDAINLLHGAPLSVSCTHPMLSSDKRCHFRWMVGSNVPLDVYSRVTRDLDGQRINLITIMAVDQVIRGQSQAAAEQRPGKSRF
jgi:hypothetical protein